MTKLTKMNATGNELAELMTEDRLLGQGTFAHVYSMSPGTVLKVTSCKFSSLLYEKLHELYKAGKAPEGFPLVMECHGVVGEDADRIKQKAFRLERLIAVEDFPKVDLFALRADLSKYARLGRRNLNRPIASQCEIQVARSRIQQLIELAHESHGAPLADQVDWLSTRVEGTLGSALRMIGELLREQNFKYAALDLVRSENLMLTAWGLPCMADPIALAGHTPEKVKGFDVFWALLARAQHGSKVTAMWCAFHQECDIPDGALQVQKDLWDGAVSKKLRGHPPVELKSWDALRMSNTHQLVIHSDLETTAVMKSPTPASCFVAKTRMRVAKAA